MKLHSQVLQTLQHVYLIYNYHILHINLKQNGVIVFNTKSVTQHMMKT